MTRTVSLYKSMRSLQPYEIGVSQVLGYIREGRWAENVKTTDKEDLPCFTVSGTFIGSKAQENLKTQSGLLSLDIDSFGSNLPNILQALSPIRPNIYSYFKSVSGKGLCVLVAIDGFEDVNDFKEIYESLYQLLEPSLRELCKFDYLPNLNRLRYVSHDPDLFLNEQAVAYTERKEVPYKIEFKDQSKLKTVSLELNKLIGLDRIKKVDEVYTANVGQFGANGKPRHDWVLGFTRWCCRADVGEQECYDYICLNYKVPERGSVWDGEVRRCIQSSYSTYAHERGEYVPSKQFDFRDIKSCANIEEVKNIFLTFIGREEEYAEQADKDFLKYKVEFYKQIYRWL